MDREAVLQQHAQLVFTVLQELQLVPQSITKLQLEVILQTQVLLVNMKILHVDLAISARKDLQLLLIVQLELTQTKLGQHLVQLVLQVTIEM